MNRLIIIITLLITLVAQGQDFDVTARDALGNRVVTFIDKRTPPRIPIIINKITTASNIVYYEIGFYLIVNLLPPDFFMANGGRINMDGGQSITINEEPNTTFLSGGKHQISIRHKLTTEEFLLLQKHKIESLIIGKNRIDIDRFEKDFLKDVFVKIENR